MIGEAESVVMDAYLQLSENGTPKGRQGQLRRTKTELQFCHSEGGLPCNSSILATNGKAAMNRHYAFLFFLISLSPTTVAQNQAPKLLREAAQCLVAKTFLGAGALNLGYLVDTRSWPSEEALYVVSYTGSSRSRGYVFTIFVQQENGHRILHIQNNAKFARAKKGIEGVDFVEPPLGGVWTQEHLVAAIKRIEGQPRFVISPAELKTGFPLADCQSYADPR
jgi:hypothetical protein